MKRKTADRLAQFAAFLLAAFCLFPIVWLALTSLKLPEEITTARGVVWWPSALTFRHFVSVWATTDFPALFLNSLRTTGITLLLCLVLGVPAAYALSRQAFRGRRALMLGLIGLRMFPAVMMIIPLFLIMRNIGLLDTSLGLALAYASFLLPLFIWLMKGFFDALPPELEEAARIDGCTRLGAMVRVALPLARNGMAATGIFIAIAAWNEFLFALMLTSSGGSRTWPVGLQLMIGEFQMEWGILAAGGILSIIPVVILFALVQRTMVAGLTEGATKG
jgi:multiple sugar transport system permease protein